MKNARFEWRRSPVPLSSAHTSIPTSIDVVNARVTVASSTTTSPSRTAARKSTESTDAVTTVRFEWRWAAIAAQTSIKWRSRPPMRLPSVFVSFGSTSSFIRQVLAEGGLGVTESGRGGGTGE